MLAGELAEAAGQPVDDALLEAAQAVEVDRGLAEGDAPVLGEARLLDQPGDVQQRLRGDAAAVEAHPAGVRLLVDERDVHAHVGGEERGRIAAGAAANDCQPDTSGRVSRHLSRLSRHEGLSHS